MGKSAFKTGILWARYIIFKNSEEYIHEFLRSVYNATTVFYWKEKTCEWTL